MSDSFVTMLKNNIDMLIRQKAELLNVAKDMYAEIETRVTEYEKDSGYEISEDMQNDLNKWFAIIKQYDPTYLSR